MKMKIDNSNLTLRKNFHVIHIDFFILFLMLLQLCTNSWTKIYQN